MTPVANFLVSPNLLIVQFTDISTNTPTSWSWDFGDAGTSTSQNPSHTYSSAGTYIVKLTATNVDGSSILQRQIVVATVPVLPVSLKTFVNLKLPSGVTINEETKDAYIAQWQLFIQPLVDPDVSINDVFNESAYPPLANALIAYLAAYSIVMDIAMQGSASGVGGGANGAPGVVKKIVTGPSEAEFQDTTKAASAFTGKDGLASTLQKEICTLAARLLIMLPMCPPLPDTKVLYLKAGRPENSLWTSYPTSYTLAL